MHYLWGATTGIGIVAMMWSLVPWMPIPNLARLPMFLAGLGWALLTAAIYWTWVA